jgi:anti-sigma B factor antagonist
MSQSWPSSPARTFRVHCYQTEDTTVVECNGKLTLENASLLKSEAKSLIGQKKRMVLDLKEVPLMDSAGLGVIMELYASAQLKGKEFELVNANKQVRELFGISKLLTLFEAAGHHGAKIT